MATLNEVIIKGRIGNDLVLKTTPSGKEVCSFRLAVDNGAKDKNGEKEADWFDVVAWENAATFLTRYFQKGRTVIVIGSLRNRKYTDRNGNTRIQTEIKADDFDFADSKPDTITATTAPAPAPVQYSAATQTQANPASTLTPYTPPQTSGYAPNGYAPAAPGFPKYDDDPDLPF